jgi:hypothetical protein
MHMAVFWLLHCVVWQNFTDVSEVLAASCIALMVKATKISDTMVNFYQTT